MVSVAIIKYYNCTKWDLKRSVNNISNSFTTDIKIATIYQRDYTGLKYSIRIPFPPINILVMTCFWNKCTSTYSAVNELKLGILKKTG